MPGDVPAGTVSPSGLARLWRSSRSHAVSVNASAAAARRLARKREDIEHASCRGLAWKVFHCVDETERRRRIGWVKPPRDDCARPTADTGHDRDVLAAVRSSITDRLADAAAAGLERPQELAGAAVDRLERAVHGSIENHVAAGREGWAPQRQVFLDLPD